MPFNGSGTFSPPAANYPAVANTLITAANRNAIDADVATGLSTAITKDGQTTVTANIPFNGFRLTGVGNPSLSTDAVNLRSIQNGTGTYISSVGGTANAITLTPTPAITAYAAGQEFNFIVATTNTAAVTIATNGLTARDLKKRVSGGLVALVANDLIAGSEYKIYDDGTRYVLEGVRTYSHGADIASASTINLDTATGDCVDVTGTTTITAITLAEGEERTIRFTGILTFTNGASLVLPGAANITTAAGDICKVRGYASGVVRVLFYTRASLAPTAYPVLTSLTNSLGADVNLNNTANYFDGPSVAQGTTGTWLATGTVSVQDPTSPATMDVKLWDGTTVIASTRVTTAGAGFNESVSLSGILATPAGNIRMSVKDSSTTAGKIFFNTSGNSKDSTISAIRIL